MFNTLRRFAQTVHFSISEPDWKTLTQITDYRVVEKGNKISFKRRLGRTIIFIESGALVVLQNIGEEKRITNLATKDHFVFDVSNNQSSVANGQEILATAKTFYYEIDYDDLVEASAKSAFMLSLFNHLVSTKVLQDIQHRRLLNSFDGKERFTALKSMIPNVDKIFTLKQIASFICLRPESLSRILQPL
ncbi:MAG: hypothetical protein WBP58_12740 [Chitinophagaceae bacterium]